MNPHPSQTATEQVQNRIPKKQGQGELDLVRIITDIQFEHLYLYHTYVTTN